MRPGHDVGTVARDGYGWRFTCACGYSERFTTEAAASFMALNHGAAYGPPSQYRGGAVGRQTYKKPDRIEGARGNP